MDPYVPRVGDIDGLDEQELLALVVRLDLRRRVNEIIWNKLYAMGYHEGNLDAPAANRYRREEILEMKRDTATFLTNLGLWNDVRQFVSLYLYDEYELEAEEHWKQSGVAWRQRGEKARKWTIDNLVLREIKHGDIIYTPSEYRALGTAVFYTNSEGLLVSKSTSGDYIEIPLDVSRFIEDPVDFYSELSYFEFEHGIDIIEIEPGNPILLGVTGGRPISPSRKVWWSYVDGGYFIATGGRDSAHLDKETPDMYL